MQYARTFLEDAYNASPAGVSLVMFNASDSSMPGNVQWAGAADTTFGDRHLNFGGLVNTNGTRRALQLDIAAGDVARADAELFVRFLNVITDDNQRVFLGARVSGTAAAPTGYFAELRYTGANPGAVVLVKVVAGAETDLASVPYNFATTDVLLARFRVQAGALSARVWTDGTAEPAAWTVTAADAAIAAAGALTFGHKKMAGAFGNNSTFGLASFVCIGTGGDAAPAAPLYQSDFLAFLAAQDALRCVLAEIDVLAQDVAGNALTGRLCAANIGFVSGPEDRYPNAAYEEILLDPPEISRRMNDVFQGQATLSYGDLILKNEVSGDDLSARLDDWKRFNFDGRPLRVLLGHPSWRRCDFRTVFLGSTQDLFEQERGKLGFHVRGPEALFQRPLSTALIGGAGPNAANLSPVCLGSLLNVPTQLYDANTLCYHVGRNMPTVSDVRDKGGSLALPSISVTAFDQASGVYTTAAPHNLVVNASVWNRGAPTVPAPGLGTANAPSFVVEVQSATTFRVSPTRGGAVALGPASFSGAAYSVRAALYGVDGANGNVYLVSQPQGSVTVQFTTVGGEFSAGLTASGVVSSLASVAGQSVQWDPSRQLTHATGAAQFYEASPDRAVGDCIDEASRTIGASACFTRQGLFYLTIVDIPGATAKWTLVADDIRGWGPGVRLLPSEVERLGYAQNYQVQSTDDLLSTVTPANRDFYGKEYSVTVYAPNDAGIDAPTNHLLRTTPPVRPTLFLAQADATAESQRLYTLYRHVAATYKFTTDAKGFAMELGDLVNITYPRDGFSAGKNAVIIGTRENAARGWVELEVFCQIQPDWPVVTAANPIVSQAYY